jgi:predicted oxidoreductase (fatty acid repression mutant protein)
VSIIEFHLTSAFSAVLRNRRSARRLLPGAFPATLVEELASAARLVPSSFDAQPWRVVVLRERNVDFWELVTATIEERLEGDRRDRYLARAAGMRDGGMTLLIFEDLALSAPQDRLTPEEARDHTAQSLGMLQLTLWLSLTAHGLATSPQHWHEFLEDVALSFAGLPEEGFRLVAFMPVGRAAESPGPRAEPASRVSLEVVHNTTSL